MGLRLGTLRAGSGIGTDAARWWWGERLGDFAWGRSAAATGVEKLYGYLVTAHNLPDRRWHLDASR